MVQMPQLPGRYRLDPQPIGRGGFGVVFRAVDLELSRPVAVKVPYKSAGGDLAQEVAAEVQAVGRIRHPGIIEVLDSDVDEDGAPFLVMEYAGLGSLRPWVESGPPSWDALRRVLDLILSGLGYAHAVGVVHRDIKDQNILLAATPEGMVIPKIADFGLARLRDRHGASGVAPAGAGTILYMPPESFEGEPSLEPAADLYAFGVLTYLLTAAHPPWDGVGFGLVTSKMRDQPRPWRPRAGLSVPAGLGVVLERWLARQPGLRPSLAADLRADLDAVHAGRGAGTTASIALGARELASTSFPPVGDELPDRPPERPSVAGAAPTPGIAVVRHPRFVDRHAERESLWTLARSAREKPLGISLIGPSGSGRSRLAGWLAETLEELGRARVLHLRFRPDRPPVDALAASVRGYLGAGRATGPALADRLGAWAASRGDSSLAPVLIECLDNDTVVLDGDPRTTLARWLAVTERLLRLSSARGVAVLWLEELAPTPGVTAMAEALLRSASAAPYPLLLLHDGPPGAIEGPRDFHRLELSPLPTPDLKDLLTELCPRGTDVEALASRARGNPARAVEAARLAAVRSRGVSPSNRSQVRPESAEVSATVSVPAIALARVRDFIGRGTDEGQRELLVVLLALLPRPTSTELLFEAFRRSSTDAAGGRLEPRRLLDDARLAGLIVLDDRTGADFSAAAIGEAALDLSAQRTDSATLKGVVGRLLLERAAPSAMEARLVAARLLLQANAPGEALDAAEALLRIAEARDVGAVLTATGLAVDAAGHLGISPQAPRVAALILASARACRRSGDSEGARERLKQLDPQSLPPGLAAAWHEADAGLHILATDLAGAEAAARRASQLWRDLGDLLGQSRVALLLAETDTRLGRLEKARDHLATAARLAEDAGSGSDRLQALWRQGRLQRIGASYALAEGTLREALRLARDLGQSFVEAVALRELGNVAMLCGNGEQAEESFRAAIALLEATGFRSETAATRISLGELARKRPDLEGARREYAAALALARAYGNRSDELVALLDLGIVEIGMGRFASAARRIESVDAVLAPGLEHRLRPWIEGVRLAVLAERGDWDGAEATLGAFQQRGGAPPDQDLLDLIERAGQAAERAGESLLATDAWALAEGVAERLGATAAVARLRARQAALGLS